MNAIWLASLLEYPEPWLRHGLLAPEFFMEQAAAAVREYDSRKPVGGTEHWRYGGFLYWLRQRLDKELLDHLLEAALADPDPPMAGNILKAIVAQSAANAETLKVASSAVATNPGYCVQPDELASLFVQAHASSGNAA